jgi:conjugative relaxase-like TrwC/TraI family protein
MNQQKDATATKGYLNAIAEYFGVARQERSGQWGGEAADRLGLIGEVEQLHFSRMIDNLHPFTGEQLTARMRAGRRCGYDFNFHSCKGASLLYAMTGDEAIVDAFIESVRDTMREIEKDVKVRVRKHGQMGERTVGNFAFSEHPHFTARPVDGVIDPHLHMHCFVPNVCWDHVERMWKAIDVASVQENAPRWQAMMHRRFGERLGQLGYPVDWKEAGFEIAGIDRATIDRFSRRTNLIDRVAIEQGITDAHAKDQLGAKTRERKRKDLTMPQLREQWMRRLTERDKAALTVVTARRRFTGKPDRRHPLPSGDGLAGRQRRQRLDDDQARHHDLLAAQAASQATTSTPAPRPGHGR